MRYVGKWIFHSIGMIDDDSCEMVYLSAEEYLKAPMPYVDESDEEAVADELKERKQMIGGQIAVCEDGKLYMLMPLPEGVSREEVDKAVEAGIIKLYDGMMADEPRVWEERDGELWLEVGEGMSEDGWVKASDGEGFLLFMTTRYVKAE
ncbi:MAG: hypothetical protein E7631_10395 [Ruminococcaceae bacterium]|nr:hypothetical protein [Oscillospiraceae bacterium]